MHYSLIIDGEVQYCFVRDKNRIPEGFEYVIHSNKQLTSESFETIILKEWLKHPKDIDYSPSMIRDSWQNKFYFKEEDVENRILGLRIPQISALHSILSHLKISNEVATVVMPTGTGKTETMLSVLATIRCEKLLITVPSDALRNQLSNKFITFGLLKKFGILELDVINPKVGILKQGYPNLEDLYSLIDESNVVITTMSILANYSSDDLARISTKFSHLFIDEAHHARAGSWEKVVNSFQSTKIIQFTATPFRQDGKALDGKVIFNFTLKMAQEQGYFKPIDFLPIREYDLDKGDTLIAETAVARLREDIGNGYNHILMARCETKSKAEEVYEIYSKFNDLNPVMVYSSIPNKKEIIDSIINLEHKIIVAVNMLGEGFDLPQLKIAAFHDIRKSLPITLQFAGRFTRTALDSELGTASFIANIADINVEDELSDLYARDANWNSLLAQFSTEAVSEQMEFYDFINEFKNIQNCQIPLQNIRFPMSAMVYRNDDNTSNTVYLNRFEKGLQNFEECEYHFSDYNEVNQTLVVITADKSNIDWVNYKEVYGLDWRLLVVHYNEAERLLFIHDSAKADNFDNLAQSVLVEPKHIKNLDVFRILSGIDRLKLQNVGLKEFLNKNVRFTMSAGPDLEEALSDSALRRTQKSFVSGAGYTDGNRVTIGCSYKGRIWSKLRGNFKDYITWCAKISNNLNDLTIDPNQVLKATLIPKYVNKLPTDIPIFIDWDVELYLKPESKIYIEVNGQRINFSECSINLTECDSDEISFEVQASDHKIKFKQIISTTTDNGTEEYYFKITKASSSQVYLRVNTTVVALEDYFNRDAPSIWYIDGSCLTGNEFVEIKQVMKPYPVEKLIAQDWTGVNISKESQHVEPLVIDSIQYKVIQDLLNEDFDIIYDDDGSGEIADVIAIRDEESRIYIQLHHLKYAKKGRVSTRIDNFYEVCGQAQKSIIWKQKKGSEFFSHLIRRQTKNRLGNERSRIEKGSLEKIENLMKVADRKPVKFEVFI